MQIKERHDGDVKELRRMARRERDAEQRDRLLVAAHAVAGMATKDIQEALVRSRGFVQRWAYAYRDGGIDALRALPRGGSEPRVGDEQVPRLRERLDAGALPSDGVCALRGRNVQGILAREFDVDLSLSAVYRTLERIGYSNLAPRPRHENHDPEAQRQFSEESAPFLSTPSARRSSRAAGGSASTSWTRRGSASRER